MDQTSGMEPQTRAMATDERALIEWLLRRSGSSEHIFQQLDALTVVSKCTCGCPTVYFSVGGEPFSKEPEHILADYLATVDGKDVGVVLFDRGGRLSSLEVYSMAGSDEPFGLPEIETIRSYDELEEGKRNQNL